MLTDNNQRQLALDSKRSFLVQAPAGSGKTSLLTQRFLVLLSQVNLPEEILAITFTRKAANEMRQRIIDALEFAASTTAQPDDAYLAKTWQLAHAALKRDNQQNWQLLHNSSRLQIKTIDSLCTSLTNALPILAKFGAQPAINSQPNVLYQQAVDSLLDDLDSEVPWQQELFYLLLHLDNNVSRVSNLLINLLSKRDHWLPLILHHRQETDLRQQLEHSLVAINQEILSTLNSNLHATNLETEVFSLLKFAAQHTENPLIQQWFSTSSFPKATVNNKQLWLGLIELLLTEKCTWRKTLNIKQGFPPETASKDPAEKALFKEMKQRVKQLLTEISTHDNLLTALIALKNSPPLHYSDNQWQILYALLNLLPILCAKLRIVFSQVGEVDFTEMMLASLMALGEEDNPTDLSLSLDYKLKHLLVDEFQDTSVSQLHLLEKLTYGWQPNDGRTLFLVGDPMQSIYRFRNAEVSLFLQCKANGINLLKPEFLALETNFRSYENLVAWFNQTFRSIFAAQANLNIGAIPYSPSHANKTQTGEVHTIIKFNERTAEAEYIVQLIQQLQAQTPEKNIALLVRSRNHLEAILPALDKQQLSYQGVDLAPLTQQSYIQDLLALTKALLNPADRTAWLAVLHAPYCGLCLEDLLIISQTAEQQTIWQRINDPSLLNGLPDETYYRLQHLINILNAALATRLRKPLATWIKDTWTALGAPHCLNSNNQLADCEVFFNCLRENDQGQEISDFIEFRQQLDNLYAKPNNDDSVKLHIMTIHKAKGLEYDFVIIPGIDRGTADNDQQLMLWAEIADNNNAINTVLAPIKASDQQKDPIYHYLNLREKQCLLEESKRLFYVGCTRAKQSLYLIGCIPEKNPSKGSFLDYLATAHPHLIEAQPAIEEAVIEPDKKPTRKLQRLPIAFYQSQQPQLAVLQGHNVISSDEMLWQANTQNLIGTVIHRLLQQISEQGLEHWPEQRLTTEKQNWQIQLKQLGMQASQLENAIEQIYQALNNTLNDEFGRWLLGSHPQAYSEFALTSAANKKVQQYFIDRVIIDKEDNLWFIDYKTTLEPQQNLNQDEILNLEKRKYQQQLSKYQKIISEYFNKPPRFGLYFTAIPLWLECTNEIKLTDD